MDGRGKKHLLLLLENMKIYRDIVQGEKEWFEKKLGTISGTYLSEIMGTPKARESAFYEILAERLTPSVDMEYLYENPMARGVRLEPEAVKAFEYVTSKQVERVGLCESDESKWIIYSPDGLIGETEDLEIKCPLGKNYMKIVLTNEVPKEYHYQIIQGFIVNPKLQKRYFVAYNKDIVSYPIHIIEVTRESLAEEIAEALEIEKTFLQEIEEKLKTFNK